MIVGIQSLTLKCVTKVFSLQKFIEKTPYNFVGNESLYKFDKGMRYTHFKKLHAVSFASYS